MADNTVPIFELQSVDKRFGGRPSLMQWLTGHAPTTHAVQSVSFSVRQTEVLGIIGESGSGKSTLGYLLANLEVPTSGSILFHGAEIATMDAVRKRQFRKSVQVIFQDSMSSLNPRRRVDSAVRDALRLSGVPRKQRSERTREIADLVGLSASHLQSYPHELSGGQRQRIGIARALAMGPEVIVADEPVSALDVSLQGQIINLLMDLRRKLGLTIVLISHDLAVVRNVSDRVGVMFGGRLVEWGDTDTIISNPKHPYTNELIASVPKGIAATRTLASISEERSADAGVLPESGCPYANRCGRVMPACRLTFPELAPLVDLHRVACHLYPTMPNRGPI